MYTWAFAYCEARKGIEWQRNAVDRFRFKDRIGKIQDSISYIFQDKHRTQVLQKKNSLYTHYSGIAK